MEEIRIATAADTVPEPWMVAGKVLQPFCLGHHLLMKRLGLPFAGNAMADAGREDVILGVALCAEDYSRTLGAMLDGSYDLGAVLEQWRRRVSGRREWRRFGRRRKVDWDEAEYYFRGYLAQGYDKPPVWNYRDRGGLELSAPWEELLKLVLMRNGFAEREVLTGYLPARWYDYYTALELENAAQCKDVKHWRRVFTTARNTGKEATIP
jgi:hypothetical protein